MPKISEARRRAQQSTILDAATRCFARNGFHRTSMADIVRESKLSPGAIYCYFRGKHDIVAAIAAERHDRESRMLAELPASGSFAAGLRQLAQSLVVHFRDRREKQRRKVLIQIWSESLRDKQIRRIVERGLRQRDSLAAALRHAQQAGELTAAVDADSLSRVMLSLLQGLILQQAWEPALDVVSYFRTAARLIETVLSTNQVV